MSEKDSQIFYPPNMQEFFGLLNRIDGIDIFSTDARRIQEQRGRTITLPKVIINTGSLADLYNINRTERYIEMGSMVNLQQICKLGKIIPAALRQALDSLYSRFTRNSTGIGGIICQNSDYEPLAAALIALNVRCELRTSSQSRWVSVIRLTGPEKSSVFHSQEILYRIRIPLEQWDFTLCRHLDAANEDLSESGLIVFLARIQNNILADVCIVFSGVSVIRDRNHETSLLGKKLPLAKKEASSFISLWKNSLPESTPPFLRDRILSFIETAIQNFTD
ncbi:MAG: FAD binding domain-containing protein [Spirochaetaceae bacterium]|nr:FAD binding domain-containing protein [Spirochaetaceae bacterium]